MDQVGAFFQQRTMRRLLAIALYVGLIVLFRQLFILVVFFVAFERGMGTAARFLSQRSGLGRRASLAIVALTVLGLLVTAIAIGVGKGIHAFVAVRASLPERIAAFKETPLFASIQEHLHGADRLVEGAQHYAADALHYLAAFGHILLYSTIGFILAVVYLIEHEDLAGWYHSVEPASLSGTLLRWLGYLGDAVSVTIQFQIVVAACNAVLTYPVLLLVRIPHATALLFIIFLSGLVPVVGNFVAGAVLTLLAYQAKGWLGVGIFVGLTFVLHKLESYYLNPRLASRHVHLPGFVLIVSLLLWEHLLGFKGLFISFPFLYIATHIRKELRDEDQAART